MNRNLCWQLACLVMPAILFFTQCLSFQSATSATYDEPLYMQAARSLAKTGSFDAFVRPMLPPLPILVHVPASWLTPSDLAESGATAWAVRRGRVLAAALFGLPLIGITYLWLLRRRGTGAAFTGATLLALSPNFVAHASLAAVDVCFALFALAAVSGLTWYYARPGVDRLLGVGVFCGLAMSAKQSAVFLFPCAAIVFVATDLSARRSWLGSAVRGGVRAIAVGLVAFMVNWACYGFTTATLLNPDAGQATVRKLLSGPRGEAVRHALETTPLPTPLVTFAGQIGHSMRGHSAYLCGRVSDHGWVWYFPVAVAVKLTPAELTLFGLSLSVALWRVRSADATRRILMLCLAVYMVMCLTSKLNLGVRYLSAAYPLTLLIAIDTGAERTGRWKGWAAGGLLLWQAASAITVLPASHLAYFNSFAGGPAGGHRYLADSNLDWGQNLPQLSAIARQHGWDRVTLAYFGSDDPNLYGLVTTPFDSGDAATAYSSPCLAVSVSYLCGIDYGRELFASFRRLTPDAMAGHGIAVYDLSRPEVRDAFAQVRAALGRRPFPEH